MKLFIALLLFVLDMRSNNPIFPIAQDKQSHLATGFIISSSITLITKQTKLKHPVLIGLGIGCLAGISKELYDLTGHGNPTITDAVYTGIGAGLGSLATFSIKIKF